MSGPIWWVTSPVSWLKPTPRSNVTEPSQTGRPSVPFSRTCHRRTGSLVSTPAIRLLESELFFLPFIEERANGRIVVGPVEGHATDDLNTGAQRDRVGRKPAGRM